MYHFKAFDPSEPRDEAGRWTVGGIDLTHPSLRTTLAAAKRGNWNLKLGRVRESWGDKNTQIEIHPNDVPPDWKSLSRDGGTTHYYDPTQAHVSDEKFGFVAPNKFSDDIPKETGLLYRGMSHEEYQDALKNGGFTSRGDYNIGEGQKGLTYFSANPDTAQSYANGFAPWPYKATPSRPAVVVGITDPGVQAHEGLLDNTGNEIGLRGKIPLSAVQRVYFGKPIITSSGVQDVIQHAGSVSAGGGLSPDSYVVWEKQPVTIGKAYDPSEPRDERGRWSSGDAMPPEPGTVSIPEGHVRLAKYDPSEERVPAGSSSGGEWTSGGGGGGFSDKEKDQLRVFGSGEKGWKDKGVYDKLRDSAEFGKILDKLPRKEGTFYRGMVLKTKAEAAQFEVGRTVTVDKHSFASPQRDYAKAFAQLQTTILHGKGTPVVLAIDNASAADFGKAREAFGDKDFKHEVVFPTGTKLKITSVKPTVINGAHGFNVRAEHVR